MGLRVEHIVVEYVHSSVLEQASAALLAAADFLSQPCGGGLHIGLQVKHVVPCAHGSVLEQALAVPLAAADALHSTHFTHLQTTSLVSSMCGLPIERASCTGLTERKCSIHHMARVALTLPKV